MFKDLLEQTFFQNRVLDYIICLLIFIFGIFIIKILKTKVLKYIKKWAEKTSTTLDNFLISIFEKKLIPLLYFGVFYICILNLTLHPVLSKLIDIIGIALLTILGVVFLTILIEYSIEKYIKRRGDDQKSGVLKGIIPALKVIIWGLGIIFLLDNLGFKISTVIAGLGIGGIAVAMASQAVLGDLFSYFAILFDRPFEVNDFIIVGDFMGAVEHVGIKTTRIRSLSGEQLIFSNTDLTNSRIKNYKRMEKRRVAFKIGVTYKTAISNLREIPSVIKDTITNINDTIFDRAHFATYGDFSLVFEAVYYVLGSDYNKYMDIQQKINMTLYEEFEKREIEFAYPTQTLYVNKMDSH